MNSLDHWRLCSEVSVIQATLLFLGIAPADDLVEECDRWSTDEQPVGFAAIRTAIRNDVLSGRLRATIRRDARARPSAWDERVGQGEEITSEIQILEDGSLPPYNIRDLRAQGVIYREEPNWKLTTVRVDDVRKWLAERGVCTGFFFPTAVAGPDYLNPAHPRYAPKLAAAVSAWQRVGEPKGKHPKQALEKWLRKHAAQFGLTDEDGNPVNQAIEECSKVANWQPSGGAPRTPG